MGHAWMSFYVGDYLADTGHLSAAEHGAYLMLILHYWQNRGLPDDEKKIAKLSRLTSAEWADSRDTLADLFLPGWRHKRIEDELANADAIIAQKKGAGTKGAEGRWGAGHEKKTRSERLADARKNGSHTPGEWQAMTDIFGGCVKCGTALSDLHGGIVTKDHLIPIYMGGDDSIENIQPMCRNCNSRKGTDTTDYRILRVPDWKKRLAERLADAWQTPGPSPSPLKEEIKNLVCDEAKNGALVDTSALLASAAKAVKRGEKSNYMWLKATDTRRQNAEAWWFANFGTRELPWQSNKRGQVCRVPWEAVRYPIPPPSVPDRPRLSG